MSSEEERADAPAQAPTPPAFAVGEAVLWTLLTPVARPQGRFDWWRFAALMPLVWGVGRMRDELGRRRARSEGFRRRGDAPPADARYALAKIVIGLLVLWRRRRSGVSRTAVRSLVWRVMWIVPDELRWRRAVQALRA